MHKGRLEAFSDGVIAIIITIMVLEIKVPNEATFQSLVNLLPLFFSYIISFLYVGIYWNNHHHLFHLVKNINGSVLWSNMFLLFWLSLIPFGSGWMGENNFKNITVVLYGVILFFSAISYYFITLNLLKINEDISILSKAIGNKFKEHFSLAAYLLALVVAYWLPLISLSIYTLVALIWLVPDRRIEKIIKS